jgi:hypothetical protein
MAVHSMLLSDLTSADIIYEWIAAVQTHSRYTGCQVSHSGSREATRCHSEIQLDIPSVCVPSVNISWSPGDLSPRRLVTIFREEGPAALYKGFVPKVLRLAPGGGVLLLVVEFTLGVFRKGTSL